MNESFFEKVQGLGQALTVMQSGVKDLDQGVRRQPVKKTILFFPEEVLHLSLSLVQLSA